MTDRAQYERFRRRRPLVLVGPRDLRPLCPARGRRGPFEFGDAGSRDAWVAVRAYHGLGARRHGGFLVKYLLDKRFVFLDGYDGHVAELRKVWLYGVFNVGTTVLFWAVEFSLWYAWGSVEAKYIGAVLGLSLGNWIKYLLDRTWVIEAEHDQDFRLGSFSCR